MNPAENQMSDHNSAEQDDNLSRIFLELKRITEDFVNDFLSRKKNDE